MNLPNKNLPFKRRKDRNFESPENFTEVIKYVSKNAFMPLTAGGKITSLEETVTVERELKINLQEKLTTIQNIIRTG